MTTGCSMGIMSSPCHGWPSPFPCRNGLACRAGKSVIHVQLRGIKWPRWSSALWFVIILVVSVIIYYVIRRLVSQWNAVTAQHCDCNVHCSVWQQYAAQCCNSSALCSHRQTVVYQTGKAEQTQPYITVTVCSVHHSLPVAAQCTAIAAL